tara:strand:+ start:895 stop:1656 length:762 start_codon:yes stop_codon:yes gene_type:complete
MEFLQTIGRGAANFLRNPIVSAVSGGLGLVNAVRSFTGGAETAASGQTGIGARVPSMGAGAVPINVASGQETSRSGEGGLEGTFFPSYSGGIDTRMFGTPSTQANILAPLAPIAGQLARQVTRNLPSIGLGAGAGIVSSQLADMQMNQTPFNRITRKLRSQIRSLYNMAGMDLEATAQLASSVFGVPLSAQDIAFILMKRFRNDGALVTKAAMRKTKKTLNALKRADDLLKMARPTATRRRAGVTQRVTKVSA